MFKPNEIRLVQKDRINYGNQHKKLQKRSYVNRKIMQTKCDGIVLKSTNQKDKSMLIPEK